MDATKKYKAFFIITWILYVVVIVLLDMYRHSPFLWFDEAGQFWIAKGLNHYSDPMQPGGGIGAVLENNAYYNMDPGGFSLLLHYWSKISDGYKWLRILPFLFFIISIVAFSKLFYRWTKNAHIAALAGFIPLCIPVVVNMSFELRAYSMEIAGTVIGLIAIESLKTKLSYKHLFLWGCVLSFFMTSRYAEIIVVFVYSLAILNIIICSGYTKKQMVIATAIYALPLLITLGCIYYFSLSQQNPGLNRMFYLTYLDTSPRVLLQWKNVLYLVALAFIFLLLILSNRHPLLKRYQLLLFSALTINAIFIILSVAGKHPWNPLSSACISMFLLVVICLMAIFTGIVLPFFKDRYAKRFYYVLPLLVLCLALMGNIYTGPSRPFVTYLGLAYTHFPEYKNIYVDSWDSPSLRYMFEYGIYRKPGKNIYPDHFTFEKHGRHNLSPGSNHPSLSKLDTLPGLAQLRQYDALVGVTFDRPGIRDSLELLNPRGFFQVWKVKRDSADHLQ